MASPFGDNGWNAQAASRFLLNRGVAGGSIAPNDATDPFNLPIKLATGGESASVFNADIDAARSAGRWLILLFHGLLPSAATWYADVDIGSVTGSMSHAKALGDVWLGTVVDIGGYWRAQKTLAAVVPTSAGDATTWTWTLPEHFPAGKYLRVTVDGGTLSQSGTPLTWDDHGYYEIALDAGSLTLTP
jgi:hypothetical protein